MISVSVCFQIVSAFAKTRQQGVEMAVLQGISCGIVIGDGRALIFEVSKDTRSGGRLSCS